MKVVQQEKKGILICYIKGEINIDTVSQLKKVFKEIVDKAYDKVLLNFEKVEYVDSVGIASLVELSKKLRDKGGLVFLSNLSATLRPIFSITKLEDMVKIYEREEEALKYLSG
ncbi:MAG: STAS domain-containing protein [Candidatus Omnitrophota bacterium]|nr:MAG: STAS domain-containing protein [Candidatus Omnitrophota bacterium]